MRISLIALLLGALFTQGAEIAMLDLTKPAPSPASPDAPSDVQGSASGGMVMRGHGDQPRWPLEITLASVDRQAYAPGEALTYEVIVTNTGTTPLDVPWSTDPALAPRRLEDRQLREASFGLVIDREGSPILLQAANGAYGSASVSGSLKRLNPGERVRVRAAGVFRALTVGTRLPAIVHVRAQFSMQDGIIQTHVPILSSNSIEVHVESAKH